MDSKDLSTTIKKQYQPVLLSDPIDTIAIQEDFEIQIEEHIIYADNETTKSETLNFDLNAPLKLKESIEESEDKPDENIEQLQVQDLIDTTDNKEISLNRLSPNVDQAKILVYDLPIKSGDSGNRIEEHGNVNFNTQVTSHQIAKITDCTPKIQHDSSKTQCVTSSNRNKQTTSIGTTDNNIVNYDQEISRKRNITEISTLSKTTPSVKESSEISILREESDMNKKFKVLESSESNMCMKMNFKLKPCSVVVEKTIANIMNVTDVCEVSQIEHPNDLMVLKVKTQSLATTEFEVSPRPLPIASSSESGAEINNSFLTYENLKINKSKRNSKSKQPILECTLKSVDVSIPKQIPLAICKKIIENKPQKVISPNINENKITDTQISQQSPKESITQQNQNVTGNKALSLQAVNSDSKAKPLLMSTPSPTRSQDSFKSKLPIDSNCTNINPAMQTSSNKPPIEEITNSKIAPKALDLEELLDGVPPFIQEVLKCDNIRDGFINEDLIFALSLLPDMEEMADSEKIQFQLRVIEIITDVFNDPVLNS